MDLTLYQVDAFTKEVFGGNPAAVCPLSEWLDDSTMQKIGMENNLAETAFFVKEGESYHIRWFTPLVEVDLCGHATLASAWVLFNEISHEGDEIIFNSKSGKLKVRRKGDLLTLDFPADQIQKIEITDELTGCFNHPVKEAFKGKTDYMLVFENEKQIESLEPDFALIAKIPARGIIATAKGYQVDFVSRFFAPQCGINEDPVTGSAHTTLTPFWAERLQKNELSAIQLSKRKGHLECKLAGDRVEISGYGVKYLRGKIKV